MFGLFSHILAVCVIDLCLDLNTEVREGYGFKFQHDQNNISGYGHDVWASVVLQSVTFSVYVCIIYGLYSAQDVTSHGCFQNKHKFQEYS